MQSWAIYNIGGPYVSNSKIGTLSPAAYGGLSYKILGSKGNEILVIQTESFGQVAIYAPADEDSSLTSTPRYGEGSTSIDSDISYIYDGIDLDGEVIVEIKPRSYWGASGVESFHLACHIQEVLINYRILSCIIQLAMAVVMSHYARTLY